MGRLGGGSDSPRTNRAAAASGDDPWVTHFGHPHHLQLTPPDPSQPPPICAGCDSRVSGGAYYFCEPCNYALDASCVQMPRRIRHPAHKDSMNIAVGDAASSCRACGRGSSGFVFLCEPCGYQVHCQCAAKQLTLKHRAHQHALHLVFSPPYEEKVFSCDVCCGAGTDHWLYRCATCDFDIHIECATSASKPAGNLQTATSSRQTEQKARPRPRGRQPSHSGDGSESSSESGRDQDGGDDGALNFAPDPIQSRPQRPQSRLGQRGRGRQTQGSLEPPAPLPVATQWSPAPRQRASQPQVGDGSDSGSESSEDQDGEDKGAQQTLTRPQGQLGQRGRGRQQRGSQQPPAPLPAATQRPSAPRQRASPSQAGDGGDSSSSESCGDRDGENNEMAQQTLPRPRTKLGQGDLRRQQLGSQQPSAPLQPVPPRESAQARPQQAQSPAMGHLSPRRPLGQSPLHQPRQPQQPQTLPPANGLVRPPRPIGQSPPPQSLWQQQQPPAPSPMMGLLNPPQQRRQLLPSQPQQQSQQQPQANPTGDDNCSCGDRYNCTCQDGNRSQGNGHGDCACGDRYNCTCRDRNRDQGDGNGDCACGDRHNCTCRDGNRDQGDGNRDQGEGNGNCACGNRYNCTCQDGNGGDDDPLNSIPNQDGGVDHRSNYYEENVEVDYSFDYHGADGSSVTVDYSCEVAEDSYVHDDSYNY
ncbi:uncharacterized protein DDB_G0284459-like [Zingiber officinale]|nr:uncharacterized protein DDB_G0284459-like [Zingiber officinale]